MCVSQTGNRIKLIDFGLAQFYDGSSNLLFMAGTPEFVAPEVIKFEPIDFHTDMWSIGVITYILLSGISPFLGETLGDTYVAVEKGEWEFDDEAFEGISDAAKDFISKLLIMNQKQRMLPEDCLNHPWIVDSRTKAANDLILNQPNSGTPLSKEGLKSYLRNKRFRKATLALVFLIRFKRQTLMNFGRRKVSTAAADAVAEVYGSLPVSIGKIMESCTESEASVSATTGLAQDDEKMKKLLTDISTFYTPRMESVTATKHPEEKKLSSEIPKKKAKPSTTDEGKKKLKPSDEGETKKGAKKQREKNSEKSDEISCKPKKVSKHLKAASGGLESQIKKTAETVSECNEVSDSKNFIPVICEVCIALETTKPAISFTEFSKSICAAESAHLRFLSSGLAQTSSNEAETNGKPKKYCVSSSGNRTAQESTRYSNSANKLSEINKKGNSVAAILSMFTEKAEQEKTRFERRPSRPVRTFRDVEKSSSRKSSLVVIHENDCNHVKLYRAPEEEKKRVKNLIELHRRGSADRKQIDTKEIVAIKQDESNNGFPGQRVNIVAQDKVEMKAISLTGKKMEINPTLNVKEGMELPGKKVTVSDLPPSELNAVRKTGQVTEERNADAMTMAKTTCLRNERKKKKKDVTEFTINQEMAEKVEKPAENILVEALQSETLITSQQKTAIQNDFSIKKNRKTKSWMKLDESQNNSSLNSLNTTSKEPKHTKSNSDKQIETVNEKRALSSEPRLSEGRCTAKKEITENANKKSQNTPKRKKDKVEIVDRNYDIKDASQKLLVRGKNFEEFIEHQDSSSEKKMKERVEKPKKSTALMELVVTPGNSQFLHKSKQMKLAEVSNSKIQKPISILQPLSADLTITTTKHNDENHDELSQCITSKKPSKGLGRKKVSGETKVKKLHKYRPETDSISSDFKNGETIGSVQNKLVNSTGVTLHSIQDTVSNVQESLGVISNSQTAVHDAVKRKDPRKNSCSKNLLLRIRSEINLAEDKEKMKSIRTRRKAVDDQAVLGNQKDKNQRSISIADLKNQENYSFGWLKLQLETRLNKEKNDQMGWRYRRDLEISPIQSGNAKKALNIWKTMEQSNITKI
ncbi:unnamed protein product [Acanthocheilonema viteae]|uniref:Protein kinase domain-containing protein n=1 Tax=Acanthocheilonema viteae TaxID=6277 RepID=A0A498SCL0_ACAVI|nr:unnamed protein product [Acanthocheilonema viteae]